MISKPNRIGGAAMKPASGPNVPLLDFIEEDLFNAQRLFFHFRLRLFADALIHCF
jgi:hypothetical protein